jgi:hypothetical protein
VDEFSFRGASHIFCLKDFKQWFLVLYSVSVKIRLLVAKILSIDCYLKFQSRF